MNAKRDWGHAKDFVNGMWLMMQQDEPEDFVLATGQTTSVREFCEMAFKHAGIELEWKGEGVNEKGINKATGEPVIEVDPQYFRPTEVDLLIGDSTKAQQKLGWSFEYKIDDLVKDMIESDREALEHLPQERLEAE